MASFYSFVEETEGWETGLYLTQPMDISKKSLDFQKKIWHSKRMNTFRKNLLKNKRHCPVWEI